MRWTIIVGLSLAVPGCGGQTCEDCDEITARIEEEVAANPNPNDAGFVGASQTPCGPEDDPSQDLAHYAEACNTLRECLDEAGDCSD